MGYGNFENTCLGKRLGPLYYLNYDNFAKYLLLYYNSRVFGILYSFAPLSLPPRAKVQREVEKVALCRGRLEKAHQELELIEAQLDADPTIDEEPDRSAVDGAAPPPLLHQPPSNPTPNNEGYVRVC